MWSFLLLLSFLSRSPILSPFSTPWVSSNVFVWHCGLVCFTPLFNLFSYLLSAALSAAVFGNYVTTSSSHFLGHSSCRLPALHTTCMSRLSSKFCKPSAFCWSTIQCFASCSVLCSLGFIFYSPAWAFPPFGQFIRWFCGADADCNYHGFNSVWRSTFTTSSYLILSSGPCSSCLTLFFWPSSLGEASWSKEPPW